jgi:hypothetical protein
VTVLAGAEFTGIGEDLARVLANAYAFTSARSRFPVVLLGILDGRLRATASDTYTVGSDYLDGASRGDLAVILERDQSLTLERACRGARKDTVTIALGPPDDSGGRPLDCRPQGGGSALLDVPLRVREATGDETRLFRLTSNMLINMESRAEERDVIDWPVRIYFSPALLAPFAKVRSASKSSTLGIRIFDLERPVYVRIGQTFRGAIMPVIPDKATDPEIGKDTLW